MTDDNPPFKAFWTTSGTALFVCGTAKGRDPGVGERLYLLYNPPRFHFILVVARRGGMFPPAKCTFITATIRAPWRN